MSTLFEIMNRPFFGKITEGEHSAIMTGWNMVNNDQNPDYSYIRMEFMIDGKSSFAKNMFARDITFFLSHTRRQLGRETEDLYPGEYFDELITNKTPLQIWFSYPTVDTRNGAREVQNISFIAPTQPNTATTASSDDEGLPY